MGVNLTGIAALIGIILFLGLPIWLVTIVVSRVRRKVHNVIIRWDNIVKTEFEAPMNLSPAELGFLTDSKFGKNEFIATLLDLEQRGIIKIEKNTTFKGYKVIKMDQKQQKLADHESFVFKNVTDTIDLLNFINGNTKKFKTRVMSELERKELIKKHYIGSSILSGRIIGFLIILSFLVSFYFLILSINSRNYADGFFFFFLAPIFLAPILIPISIMGGYLYNSVVGETSLWTKKMKSAWAEVEGYKEFIKQVELDNIQFESSELKQKTKNKALPYAVAMGFNTDWEKRF